jgi:hypothetical protein
VVESVTAIDKFMLEALREVDAIGYAAPTVAPPPTGEELQRLEDERWRAEMAANIERVRREAGNDPYQQDAAEERARFMAQR